MSTELGADVHSLAIDAALAQFPVGNPYGVFGAAIARKRVRGHRMPERTLVLYVERKLPEPESPVPPVKLEVGGKAVEIVADIVATGGPVAAAHGTHPTFTGLHAGAAIRVDAGSQCAGGVACLLALRGAQSPTHLLTAGHLFPANATADVQCAAKPGGAPVVVGKLTRNLLDALSIDAALVELTPAGVTMARASASNPRWPELSNTAFDSSQVNATWLKVFLPTRGDYVTHIEGESSSNGFSVKSGCRAKAHAVRDVIATDFAHNTEGNSGTLLMTDGGVGAQRVDAVGIAIAFVGSQSLHEPVDRVLRNLSGDFDVWSGA